MESLGSPVSEDVFMYGVQVITQITITKPCRNEIKDFLLQQLQKNFYLELNGSKQS